MILFLDFDGTTHPIPCKDVFFCHLPRIENVLRDYPHVKVVISSWWRASHSLEGLRDFFSEDIQPRVIGVTPIVPLDVAMDLESVLPFVARHDECLAWMAENAYKGPWIALDDAVSEFPAQCVQLVPCQTDVGFDRAAETDLRLRLQAFSPFPPLIA